MAILAALVAALAAIGAAFLNADLSRKRDDALRLRSSRALAAALSAEIAAAAASAADRAKSLFLQDYDNLESPALAGDALPFPDQTIWKGCHPRVGELPTQLAWEVVAFEAYLSTVESYRICVAAAGKPGPVFSRQYGIWMTQAAKSGPALAARLKAYAEGLSESEWPPIVAMTDAPAMSADET